MSANQVTDRTPSAAGEPPWVGVVLDFWFAELAAVQWFAKDGELDAQISSRFLPLHEQLVRGNGAEVSTPRALLAAVIVLDQFSRNMFRGDPRAYAADALARRLARSAVDQQLDLPMSAEQRYFLYLPFEHSEDAADQALALRLVGQLGNSVWTQDTAAHKAIIDRFGRFPHRNQALNRPSTPEEIAHLAKSGISF